MSDPAHPPARGRRYAFNPTVTAVCLAAYRSARFLVLATVVAPPVFAINGVIAGCGFATTLIRVFTLAALDGLSLPRSISLRVYIDD